MKQKPRHRIRLVSIYVLSDGNKADFEGNKLWHRDFGQVLHKWGNGGSPILYKDLLIVYQGPGEPTFLTALKRSP